MFFQCKWESETPGTCLSADVTPHSPEEQLACLHHRQQQWQLLAVLVRTKGGHCDNANSRSFDHTAEHGLLRSLRQVRKAVSLF